MINPNLIANLIANVIAYIVLVIAFFTVRKSNRKYKALEIRFRDVKRINEDNFAELGEAHSKLIKQDEEHKLALSQLNETIEAFKASEKAKVVAPAPVEFKPAVVAKIKSSKKKKASK
jgi:hypothetical protein